MMINAELLQKLREPQIQAELRPLVEVGWWAYIVNLQSGFTGKGTWRLVTFVRRAPATIWIHNKIFNEGAYTLAPSTDWLWAKLMELDIIAYFNGCDTEVEINPNKIESEFTAPTLHEALLQAWLWWREHVKEV